MVTFYTMAKPKEGSYGTNKKKQFPISICLVYASCTMSASKSQLTKTPRAVTLQLLRTTWSSKGQNCIYKNNAKSCFNERLEV